MQITFGKDFDGGSWPDALGGVEAVAGAAWVGPNGLLRILEAVLGLGGPVVADTVRIASVVPALSKQGFWSASAELNPLATARELLRLRDRLFLCGWSGEAPSSSPRLEALAAVTAGVSPGVVDRLSSAVSSVSSRDPEVERLELCEPRSSYPGLWQQMWIALEHHGTRVVERRCPSVEAEGDLGHVKNGRPPCAADGSLQLLRPYGLIAAAEEVGAWLASQPDLTETVVIGADEVLDRALARHGLPAVGGRGAGSDSAGLQILPGILEFCWQPPDPRRVAEFLLLHSIPIPRGVAWRLSRALDDWPAVGSKVWREALVEGLETIEDSDRQEAVGSRLDLLLAPVARREDGLQLVHLETRIEAVIRWLLAPLNPGGEELDLRLALEHCRLFLDTVHASGLSLLTEPQVARFSAWAASGVRPPPSLAPQAGLQSLASPGGLVGAVRRVVWWNFSSEAAPSVPRFRLSRKERAELAACGVVLPPPAAEAEMLAASWRRPLDLASQSLLLVCPRHGDRGGEIFPHPLWDELVGRFGVETLGALEVECPKFPGDPEIRTVEYLAPPAPRLRWRVPSELLPPRERESPSSLSTFLGCSLRWTLKYQAGLRSGRSAELPSDAIVRGNILHEVVERVLREAPDSPKAANVLGRELFRELSPGMMAALYLPGGKTDRIELERTAGAACEELQRFLARTGRRVSKTEETLEGQAFGLRLGGRLDVLLDPAGVIDLKLGGGGYRRRLLREGAHLDLLVYRHLAGHGGSKNRVPVAYFILTEQALISSDAELSESGEAIAGPDPDDVWEAFGRAARERRAELARGEVGAPGADGSSASGSGGLQDGRFVSEPPCKFCGFAAFCGLKFVGEASP